MSHPAHEGFGPGPRTTEAQGRPERTAADRLRTLKTTLAQAGPDQGRVAAYLRARGLSGRVPEVLRFAPALTYSENGTRQKLPAMLAPVVDVAGELVSVHRIYLDPGGSGKANVETPKKLMPAWEPGATRGAAVRLAPAASVLALAEGIETALAVMEATTTPTWATVSAGGMEAIEIPPDVQRIELWCDRDPSGRGREAAEKAAARLHAEGREVFLLEPPSLRDGTATDWLDVMATQGPRVLDAAAITAEEWQPEQEAAEEADASEGFRCTDLGNAERMALVGRDTLRYEHVSRSWYAWDGHRWERDATLAAESLAHRVTRAIYAEAAAEADDARRDRLGKHAVASEAWHRQRAMVEACRHLLAVKPDAWDADPMTFNCRNGTLDLENARLRDPNPADHLTKISPVAFDPDAEAPIFERFLREVVPDSEVRGFLRRSAGLALTGDASEHHFWFLFGPGRNGKSTLTNLLLHVLGDYGMTAAEHLLERGPDRHPTELAALRGARLAVSHETQEGRRLDETRVKKLTGGDPIPARFMRGDYFQFDPTHKLWLHGNHKPVISGTDEAIWSRPLLVDFAVIIPPEERDTHLSEKLEAEASGVLNWALLGCLEWQKAGLCPPASVRSAIASYRLEEDRIGAFLAERTVEEPGGREGATALFGAYQDWCKREGEEPVSGTKFGRSLNERGIAKGKDTRGKRNSVVRIGIRLRSPEGPEGPEAFPV